MEPGTRLTHYEILDPIGSGAMGDVYRARDTRLDRFVAIKILPDELASDPSRVERFIQEARAASALNHPNIVQVYDVGTHEGTRFIVMEYVVGRTLREILKDGALAPERLLAYASQLAEGLAKAHGAGVVHRDLKPENIMVSADGYLKILDFGLAKLFVGTGDGETEAPTLERAGTAPGVVLGTAGYMSPEQVRGLAADHRSDQFAFGAIVYELATGRRAFEGDTMADRLSSILRDNPASARVSRDLQSLITRCLSKSPDARFVSTEELVAAVRGLSVQTTDVSEGVQALAVMPFENMSSDPEQDYFCDGMTDEIINVLSQLSELRVTARTSAFALKGQNLSLVEIGDRLKVQSLLEGSVRKAGRRVRITAQLVDVADGYPVWSEKFDRELEDVFAIQEEIAGAIADKLRLAPDAKKSVTSRGTADLDAHDAYLLGLYDLHRRTTHGVEKAIQQLERAVALDPQFAEAHAALAEALTLAGFGFSNVEDRSRAGRALETSERAVELASHLPEASAALGMCRLVRRDFSGAEEALARALEKSPNHPKALEGYAHLLLARGEYERSYDFFGRALESDPLSISIRNEAGWPLLYLGRHEEAEIHYREVLEIDPSFGMAHYNLGNAHEQAGRYGEAIACYQQAMTLVGRAPFVLASLARVLVFDGKVDEARKIKNELTGRMDSGGDFGLLAIVCDALDEPEEALSYLERAETERSSTLMMLLSSDEYLPFENTRDEPRYRALVERMKTGSKPESPEPRDANKAIAVVPFRNLSVEKDTEYFSDGLSEDIMLDLAKVAGLRVISRASAMHFKEASEPLQEIGRKLNVPFVLEGSVRRAGENVRITARLVDVYEDAQLWSERYVGSLDNVFDFQEEIARKIVAALRVTLTPEESKRLSERPFGDVEGYQIFLQARPLIWSFTADGLERAQRLLQEAIDRLGDNELLYSAMAAVHWQYVNAGVRPEEAALTKAREYRDKVFAIRPDSANGFFVDGLLAISDRHTQQAVESFERVLAEQPSSAEALLWVCLVHLYGGRTAAAKPYIETLLQIDPYTPVNRVLLGWSDAMDGRLSEAASALKKLFKAAPDNPIIGLCAASMVARAGDDGAIDLFRELAVLAPGTVFEGLGRFFVEVLQGNADAARAVGESSALFEKAWWDWQYSWEVASGYALLGEKAEAVRWLRNSVERGFTNYPFFNEYDPFLENLRGSPEFTELMEQTRRIWEDAELR